VRYAALRKILPAWLLRHVMHFEAVIEEEVGRFGANLPDGALVLDAGAGEARHAACFRRQRYVAADLAVGDTAWDYGKLDAVCDLEALPFATARFSAAVNVVTLEHVKRPQAVLLEIARVLAPGGRLLLIAPHEWEVHQAPNDYFRYTRHGLEWLLRQAGFIDLDIQPVGGYFRLLARRLLNGLQFFPGPLVLFAAIFFVPPALVLPWLDSLDRDKTFTLGYTCTARKR
jgi:SAM-dependent methyltransferase